jgi:hypothetical protein
MQLFQRYRRIGWSLLALLGVLLIGIPAMAQSGTYLVPWWTVDSGGIQTTSGDYIVRGAAGQPDVHTGTGGDYTVRGGFWQPLAEETPQPDTGGTRIYLPFVNTGSNEAVMR